MSLTTLNYLSSFYFHAPFGTQLFFEKIFHMLCIRQELVVILDRNDHKHGWSLITSPQINNWLLDPQSSLPIPEKVRKQRQECPLMANEQQKILHSQLWLHAHAHGLCPSTHKILEFQADRILTSLFLALEVSGDLCVLLRRICIKHSGKQQSQNSSQPITGLSKAQCPTLFCTFSQRWNKATWIQ